MTLFKKKKFAGIRTDRMKEQMLTGVTRINPAGMAGSNDGWQLLADELIASGERCWQNVNPRVLRENTVKLIDDWQSNEKFHKT